MMRDANEVPPDTRLSTEVCIVGGGVVGLALARELGRRRIDVCVVESGGRVSDPATQELAQGTTHGDATHAVVATRRRQLGGSAHLWDSQLDAATIGFRCAPLDAIDFERRDEVPDSGWPFDKAHLDPYYERAQEVCGLGPYRYDGRTWESPEAPLFPLGDTGIETTVWQFGEQRRFLRDYPAELESIPGVMLLLNANVTEIAATAGATAVVGVSIATLSGRRFQVNASTVVLAAGGLENARLLLLSNSVAPRGLGNDRDLVGRYFMEHPIILAGRLFPSRRSVFDRAALYDVTRQRDTVVMGKLSLSEAVLRREKLLNAGMLLLPTHGTHKPEAIDSLKLLLQSPLRGRVPGRARAHIREVLGGLDFVGVSLLRKLTGRKKLFPFIDWGPGMTSGVGWSALDRKAQRYSAFDAYLLTEQPPLRDNRVVLSDELDALGCRRLELHWRWDDRSRQSVADTERLFADAVARSGFGRFQPRLEDGHPYLMYPGQHHHLGTTRMHHDPARGVVDGNGRVHGIANLYVSGGSVFPTGGFINPTHTMVALGLRLADHIAAQRERPALVGPVAV